MRRTANRPLPAGRLDPRLARAFGLALGVISLPILALSANLVTAALGLVALGSYVGVYTPMKRQSAAALVVGAVPGALPPLMGYAAVSGELGAKGLVLFALLFLWQIPHVIGLSAFRREDYVAAGIRVLPAVIGPERTRIHAVCWALVLCATSVVPLVAGWASWPYAIVALFFGAAFVWATLRPVTADSLWTWGRQVFLISLFYLPFVFVAWLLDGLV
jgi:protoheme IX farnesyltransferase